MLCVFVGGADAVSPSEVVAGLALDACDVGGEEVDAVAVEVAAGAVVVLGGARVGMRGQDLGITQRDPGVQGVCDRRCRSEWGRMWRGIPAAFAIRTTIR